MSQELGLAEEMYSISNQSWIYYANSFYINLYAYDIPWELQPSLIGFITDPWQHYKNCILQGDQRF